MEVSHGLPLFIVKQHVRSELLHDLDCQLWVGLLPLALGTVLVHEVTTNQRGTASSAGLAVEVGSLG